MARGNTIMLESTLLTMLTLLGSLVLGFFFAQPLIYIALIILALIWAMVILSGLSKKHNMPPPIDKPISLTLLILSYKESYLVARTLRALVKSKYPKKLLEVMVITKPSREDRKDFERLKKNYSKYNWIKILTHPESKAAATNFGLNKTKTDWVGLLDADSHVDNNFISTAARYIQFYNESDFVGFIGSFSVENKRRNTITRLVAIDKFQIRETLDTIGSWLNRANFHGTGFFRTDVLRLVGFGDVHPTEDIEMSTKLAASGSEVALAKHLVVNSNAPTSLYEVWHQRTRWARGNWLILSSHDLGKAIALAPLKTKIYLFVYHLMSNLAAISLILMIFLIGACIANPRWISYIIALLAAFYIIVFKELLMDSSGIKFVGPIDAIGLLYPFFFIFILGFIYLKSYLEEILKVEFNWVKVKQ